MTIQMTAIASLFIVEPITFGEFDALVGKVFIDTLSAALPTIHQATHQNHD